MSFALEVKQVTVAFGAHTVLSHITFALSPGEIGCLLGPSGCGKTSLLRTIAGFESPLVGEIWINGVLVNAKSNPIPTERRKVGMVFQDFALFPSSQYRRKHRLWPPGVKPVGA
jgi:iron(III) transport system ATP-binding protein